MIESILVCSCVSMLMSIMNFIFVITDDTRNTAPKTIARLTYQISDLKRQLSDERQRRIAADNDAAYFSDKLNEATKDLFTTF